MNLNMQVDHIGYAVKNRAEACSIFEGLGYVFSDPAPDPLRSVEVTVGTLSGLRVEVLSPLEGKKSPIDAYLSKTGCGPYHICYRTDNMDEAMAQLSDAGFCVLSAPAHSEPLGGIVAFLYHTDTGLTELIEYPAGKGNVI